MNYSYDTDFKSARGGVVSCEVATRLAVICCEMTMSAINNIAI